MPEETPSTTPDKPRKIPTEVLVALFGLIGVAVTAYFSYLGARLPYVAQATRDAKTETAESVRMRTQTALYAATRTATGTATPSATQESATSTASITATPTILGQPAGEKYCVNVRSVYVREGPGSNYGVLGGLTFEDCPYFDARAEFEVQVGSEEGPITQTVTWLRLSSSQPDYQDLEGGWVRADLVRPDDYNLLEIITLTPTLTPSPEPSATPTPLG
jgi:hypothetical protein